MNLCNEKIAMSYFLPDNKHGVRTMHSAPNSKVCALRRTRKCAANLNGGFRMPISMELTNKFATAAARNLKHHHNSSKYGWHQEKA